MWIYTIRRLTLFIIIFLILTVIGFSLLRLDASYSLTNTSFIGGWLEYVIQLMSGDLGTNKHGIDMLDEILYAFPATLELGLFAFLIAFIMGTLLGTIAGMNQGKPVDKFISSVALLGYSMPLFWIALLCLIFFSLHLGITPISGRYNILYDIEFQTGFVIVDAFMPENSHHEGLIQNILHHLFLPTLVLSIPIMTEIIRLVRSSVANVIKQNYIKVAHIKGLSKYNIVVSHIMSNALFPVIPKLGIQISNIFTAAILVEVIFNWPGIGRWLVKAITHQDFIAIQAGVITITAFILAINILLDVLGVAVNPLIRKELYALK